MFWAISAIAAAFWSRFMRLLRRAYANSRRSVESERSSCPLGGGRRLLLRSGPGRVDLHAGAHGGGQRDRLDVPALRARGLGPEDLLQQRRVVLQQRLGLEARLADGQVHVRGAVGAVLDLAGLGLLHGL